ncbi:MAG: ZapG family protein [Marinomonas sp.]
MNLEEFNIIVFVTGAIVGFAIALVLKSILSKNAEKASSSRQDAITINSLQQELDQKQVIIDNFFSDNNELLLATEKRLAELRKTLSEGASQLSQIEIPATITITQNQTATEKEVTEPPRDYALTKDAEPDTLSEEFGLKSKPENLEPNRAS